MSGRLFNPKSLPLEKITDSNQLITQVVEGTNPTPATTEKISWSLFRTEDAE